MFHKYKINKKILFSCNSWKLVVFNISVSLNNFLPVGAYVTDMIKIKKKTLIQLLLSYFGLMHNHWLYLQYFLLVSFFL